ncbi:hypothetical protein Cgig2_021280 [Carnegiea gigantea]|uniref:Uncharacterized protein n=1 Tax=Carnegiea gigantea TaxID=171969 RepID=A0A9Q1GKG9_9CARY|nr:hypothetical protein Cgig2_021280 [Carnegiea gigantea]
MGASSFISSIHLHRGVLSMAFHRSLSTGEMAEYVAYHFEWDRREVAFPPLPLPNDFQALCPSYELAVSKEAARRFELLELSQVIFYAMLLNEVERLGVLYGWKLRVMESALTELRWSTFESWVWLNGDRILEPRFREKVKRKKESLDAERVASSSDSDEQGETGQEGIASPSDDDEQEGKSWERTRQRGKERDLNTPPLSWHFLPLTTLRRLPTLRATCPPRPLLDDYQDLCPRFLLSKAEKAVLDFELPEMVPVTFYAMLLNDALELGIVSGFLTNDLKSSLEGLRWTSLETWLGHTSSNPAVGSPWVSKQSGGELRINRPPASSSDEEYTEQVAEYVWDTFRWTLKESSAPGPKSLPVEYHDLYPRFDLGVVTRYAHDSNTPEMVQAIFYAMVVDDAAELGVSRRLIMDCMMWAIRKLDLNPVESWLEDIDCRLRKAQASPLANPPANPVLPSGPMERRITSFPTF